MEVNVTGYSNIEIDFSIYSIEDKRELVSKIIFGEKAKFEDIYCELTEDIDLCDYAPDYRG